MEKIAIFFSEKGAGGGVRGRLEIPKIFPEIHPFWYAQASLNHKTNSQMIFLSTSLVNSLGPCDIVISMTGIWVALINIMQNCKCLPVADHP